MPHKMTVYDTTVNGSLLIEAHLGESLCRPEHAPRGRITRVAPKNTQRGRDVCMNKDDFA